MTERRLPGLDCARSACTSASVKPMRLMAPAWSISRRVKRGCRGVVSFTMSPQAQGEITLGFNSLSKSLVDNVPNCFLKISFGQPPAAHNWRAILQPDNEKDHLGAVEIAFAVGLAGDRGRGGMRMVDRQLNDVVVPHVLVRSD